MNPVRIGAALAGVALAAVAVGTAAASPSSVPQVPDAAALATVARTAPGQLLLRNLTPAPDTAEPLPGTLSTGLTSRHIGG